jgi:hypothetical protein
VVRYKDAITWIANEDAPADDDPPDVLAGYLTVCLVADLFGKENKKVAHDVFQLRHPEAKVTL